MRSLTDPGVRVLRPRERRPERHCWIVDWALEGYQEDWWADPTITLEAPRGVMRIGGAKVYAAKLATKGSGWLRIEDSINRTLTFPENNWNEIVQDCVILTKEKPTHRHAHPPHRIQEKWQIIRCLYTIRSGIVKTLKKRVRTTCCIKIWQRTFFVIMKLLPISTEPDKATMIPIYLSSIGS
jgi:hypothetical protein